MSQLRISVECTDITVSGKAVNVMHMISASSSVADAQVCVDDLQTFYTAIRSLYKTTATITVGARVIDQGVTPPAYVNTTPRVVTGTGAGVSYPSQLAAVVSWRTGVATRSGRGRTFLGPFQANAFSTNVLAPGTVTTIQAAANTLLATGRLFVYSPRNNAYYSVTSATVSQQVRTMRTRAIA
jgi:hypothetical protein